MSLKHILLLLILIFITLPIEAAITELDTITDSEKGGTANYLDCAHSVNISSSKAYVIASCDGAFSIFDVSNSSSITELGALVNSSGISQTNDTGEIVIANDKAYLSVRDGFVIVDISNSSNPQELAYVNDDDESSLLGGETHIAVANNKAYVTSSDHSLVIFDVSDSNNVTELGSITDDDSGGSATELRYPAKIFIKGNYAIVQRSGGLSIFDISSPSNISEVKTESLNQIFAFAISGDKAYIGYAATSALDPDLTVWDISSPSTLSELVRKSISDFALGTTVIAKFFVDSNKLYFTNNFRDLFGILDVSDYNAISLVDFISDDSQGGDASKIDGAAGIFAANDTIYVIGKSDESLSTFSSSSSSQTTPPEVSSLSPANDGTGVEPDSNLTVAFNEAVSKGSGNITIRYKTQPEFDSRTIETIDVSSSQVTVSSSTVSINPSSSLPEEEDIQVSIDSGAFQDSEGTDFAGLSYTNWEFTTASSSSDTDSTGPTISTRSPAAGATDVDLSSNIEITFNETIQAGAGNVIIYRSSDDSILEAINITSSKVTISGSTVTINPSSDFSDEEGIYITIDSGFVTDTSFNYFAGIDDNSWSYSAPVTEEETEEDTSQYEEEASSKSLEVYVRASKNFDVPTSNLRTYKRYFLNISGFTTSDQNNIKSIKWDYDGDGNFDQTYNYYKNYSSNFVYGDAGTVNPSATITYNDDSTETIEIGNSTVEESVSVVIKDDSGNEIDEINLDDDNFSKITVEIETVNSKYAGYRTSIISDSKSMNKVFKIKKKITKLANENDTLSLTFKVQDLSILSRVQSSSSTIQRYIDLRAKKKDDSTALVSIPFDLVRN